jgi:hypothetical protein
MGPPPERSIAGTTAFMPRKQPYWLIEVDGILDQLTAQLGATVNAVDLDKNIYPLLGAMPTVAGDPSRLLYDFLQIQALTQLSALAWLRAEGRKAALDKAVGARQNAWFAKYSPAASAAIISKTNQSYSPGWSGPTRSKPQLLSELVGISQTQWDGLRTAYNSTNRTGVVTTTESAINANTMSYGYGTTSSELADATISAAVYSGPWQAPPVPPGPLAQPSPRPPSGWAPGNYPGIPVDFCKGSLANWPQGSPGDNQHDESYQKSAGYQISSSNGAASQSQKIVNTDYGYRHPYCEAQAQ